MDTHTHTHFQLQDATPSPALQAWLDEERAVQARLDAGPGPGVIRPEQAAGHSGLDLMQAMLRGEVPYPPIAQTLDFLLISAGDGSAVFQGRPGTAHLNPMNGVHGGWFATLLDSALGCAVHTRMPPGRGYTTAELSINLVKGLTPRVPRVRAEGRVLHCGRQAYGRGAPGGRGRHALRPCHHHVPGVRHAGVTLKAGPARRLVA